MNVRFQWAYSISLKMHFPSYIPIRKVDIISSIIHYLFAELPSTHTSSLQLLLSLVSINTFIWEIIVSPKSESFSQLSSLLILESLQSLRMFCLFLLLCLISFVLFVSDVIDFCLLFFLSPTREPLEETFLIQIFFSTVFLPCLILTFMKPSKTTGQSLPWDSILSPTENKVIKCETDS